MWEAVAPHIVGKELKRIARKGKYLIFQWQQASGLFISHLRMTGWWAWQVMPQTLTLAQGYTLDRHPRLFLNMRWPDGSREELIYYDSRGLGEIAFFPTLDWQKIAPLAKQAADLVETENSLPGGFFAGESEFIALVAAQQKRKARRSIRDMLMDQTGQGIGAGLGNYLVAEVLYRAHLHPDRPFSTINIETLKQLYQIIVELLRYVIEVGAESEATMVVYQRKECPLGHSIQRDLRGGRGSYYCPNCQL
jgi:formamidopyrimidine-DNA glycosylase